MSNILAIARTALVSLRRDRASLALSFILPIGFFSIFATIFGGMHDNVNKIKVILVDEDQSYASRQLDQALEREGSLNVITRPASKDKEPQLPDYTAATAEEAVKAGEVSVALIIPKGWGARPISFGPESAEGSGQAPANPAQPTPARASTQETSTEIQLLYDASDRIAPQMVGGLLQKVAMTSMPLTMAEQGMKHTADYIGGFTPQQQARMDQNLAQLREVLAKRDAAPATPASGAASGEGSGGLIAVNNRSVVGEGKNTNMISYYAAAIGVMFLLFTASGSAGALLDEAESGTLDRVLSSRISITGLLGGKLLFNTLLAFTQLVVMFLWGRAIYHLDLFAHIPGFIVMGLCTSVAVASFGLLLASLCHTRGQLGAVSTLAILVMSSIGGSMFPRFLMPPAMQTAGMFTLNAWAIDGFQKVFWYGQPVTALWPQVGVLLGIAIGLFLIARRIARRWEYA
jgi:ABC-2 type transport system permease protein